MAAASGSQLEATLHDIVQAAVRHVDATYGAMGVLTADGRKLDRFVIVGMDDADRERIGRLPTGHGILGLLVAEPTTLRLDDLRQHPASSGFPDGHPPMKSFLGVPVRVGESVFGNLYLTEKRSGGPFTQADVEVAQALAGVAGLAIDNARLAEWAETRRRWEEAAVEMATALLSGAEPEQVLHAVSTRVADLTGADMAGVLAPSSSDDESLMIVAAVGEGAEEVEGVRVPLRGTYVGTTYRAGVPRLIEDISTMPVVGRRAVTVVELTAGFGPALVAPLGSAPDRSLIVILRAAGKEPFQNNDLQLLSAFAAQASVALELARAQQRERLLQVQADRDRIARDLHDHVVQRIFAAALSLDRLGRSLGPEQADVAAGLSRSVDDLHGTIVRIRTSIFELHETEDTSTAALPRRLGEVVRSVTEGHELRPELRIRCERDELPADLVLDLAAVVRELVTNVVRHAEARRITVSIAVDREVCVVVTDDGRGLPPALVRSGLANLATRAERRAGTLTCRSDGSGTEIRWAVPAPA
ncbi:MAG: Two component signal transduction histidine kinase with domain [Blastococcus sp.]|jgi:signal transduction histidine kinase|nr:Two component signal transduction histidine kinase with domain [Blastococcus sp.]